MLRQGCCAIVGGNAGVRSEATVPEGGRKCVHYVNGVQLHIVDQHVIGKGEALVSTAQLWGDSHGNQALKKQASLLNLYTFCQVVMLSFILFAWRWMVRHPPRRPGLMVIFPRGECEGFDC